MGSEKVKCVDCGFLSGRRAKDQEFYEAGLKWRRDGVPDGLDGLNRAPHCFKNACPISDEYQSAFQSATGSAEEKKKNTFLTVINAERTCPVYCDYKQGKSPKEHAEEQDEMHAAIEAQKLAASEADKNRTHQAAEVEKARKWQEEQEVKRQAWQERQNQLKEEQDAKHRAWQEEQSRIQREWQERQTATERKWTIARWVIGGIGAVAVGMCGFVGGKLYEKHEKREQQQQQTVPSPPTKP